MPLRNRLYHSCEKYVRTGWYPIPVSIPRTPPSLLLSPFYFCHDQGGRKIDNLFSTTNPSASQKVSTGRDTVTDVYIPERAPTPILERRPFSKSNRPGERRWRNGVFLKGPESFRVYRFSGYLRVCPWQDSPQVSLPVREERRGPVARNERKTRRRGESERERGMVKEERGIAKRQADLQNSVPSSGSS